MLKCLYDCASLSYIINNRTCERLLIVHGWHLLSCMQRIIASVIELTYSFFLCNNSGVSFIG